MQYGNYIYFFFFFTVEVTVRGPIDARTGMVMNITDLKLAMDGVIFKQLDHKNLDKDVEFFNNTVNISNFILLQLYFFFNINPFFSPVLLKISLSSYGTMFAKL